VALQPPTLGGRPGGPEFAVFVREGHPARAALVEALRSNLATLPGGPWRVTIRELAAEGLVKGSGEVWSVEIAAHGACALTLVRPALEAPQAVVQRIRAILGT
jgi:hypothetical protein